MKKKRITISIALPTPAERALLRLLSPAARLIILLAAARVEAARLGMAHPAPPSETLDKADEEETTP